VNLWPTTREAQSWIQHPRSLGTDDRSVNMRTARAISETATGHRPRERWHGARTRLAKCPLALPYRPSRSQPYKNGYRSPTQPDPRIETAPGRRDRGSEEAATTAAIAPVPSCLRLSVTAMRDGPHQRAARSHRSRSATATGARFGPLGGPEPRGRGSPPRFATGARHLGVANLSRTPGATLRS